MTYILYIKLQTIYSILNKSRKRYELKRDMSFFLTCSIFFNYLEVAQLVAFVPIVDHLGALSYLPLQCPPQCARCAQNLVKFPREEATLVAAKQFLQGHKKKINNLVIFYSKDNCRLMCLPTSFDLARPRWNGGNWCFIRIDKKNQIAGQIRRSIMTFLKGVVIKTIETHALQEQRFYLQITKYLVT